MNSQLSHVRRSLVATQGSGNTLIKAKYTILSILLVCFMAPNVMSQTTTTISEMQLYNDIYQGDKSYSYYSVSVTQQYFTGAEMLVFKIITSGYDSDPDIFISKTIKFPSTASQSQWYCVKDGSDTCIVKNSQVNYGDTFYFGIRCMNNCRYKLRVYYAPTVTMAEGVKTQFRLTAYSTNIFQYFIPSNAADGFTQAITLSVVPEQDYSDIDMFFSLDDDLYQIEDKKNPAILNDGKIFSFTQDDQFFCTRCYVYLVVSVVTDERYYITGTASARNAALQTGIAKEFVVSSRQSQCFHYYVLLSTDDGIFQVTGYQGEADVYLSGSTMPSSVTDTNNIKMFTDRTTKRALIVRASDRNAWGIATGIFYICVSSLYDYSFSMMANQGTYNGQFTLTDNTQYTMYLYGYGFNKFVYTHQDLSQNSVIYVTLTSVTLNNGQQPARIFYKVCSQSSADCSLDDGQAKGFSSDMTELSSGLSGSTRNTFINHNPSVCPDPKNCYYLFSTYYADDRDAPVKTTFNVVTIANNPTVLTLSQAYRNVKAKGTYEYYVLQSGSDSGQGYLLGLLISLYSVSGDADLYVSTRYSRPNSTYYDFSSRSIDEFEQVILNRSSNFSLSQPIYIAIYAVTQAEYQLTLIPNYDAGYNAKLVTAYPLTDSSPVYNYMLTEYDESFYSYQPWWSGAENRTIIFFAQVIFNKITFTTAYNDYPVSFLTGFTDWQGMQVIPPYSPNYFLQKPYYVRVRPNFALYDLISQRQYIFNFYAIAQQPSSTFIDIQVNETTVGYANSSTTFYKHQNIQRDGTYSYILTTLAGQPSLMVVINDTRSYPNISDINSYHQMSNKNDSNGNINITLTYDLRLKYDSNCEFYWYPLQAGTRLCTTYVGVYCATQCAYNLTVLINSGSNTPVATAPRYLVEGEYYTGILAKNEIVRYFYFPINVTSGDVAILLNKTGPAGQNGDTLMVMSLLKNSSAPYAQWNYPNQNSYDAISFTNSPNQPELLEVCSSSLLKYCNYTSCALVIGVVSTNPNKTAMFRIKAFTSRNKLEPMKPVVGTIALAGQYKYYWFTNNATVMNSKAYWEYNIGAGVTNQNYDVDLYVSMVDGRNPVDFDFDISSNNVGPDNVVASANDTFFQQKGYNTSFGVMMVVGVKALTNNANFQLIMYGSDAYRIQPFFDLVDGVSQQKQFNDISSRGSNNTHYFKFYNWGGKDFKIDVTASQGYVYLFFNYFSEQNFTNNAFLATPQTQNNSQWSVFLNTTQSNTLRVYKEDYGSGYFCYYCLYYITVWTNSSVQSSYRVTYSTLADSGDTIQTLPMGTPLGVTLPSTGSVVQAKFLLTTMDPFTISFTVATGYAVVYVGLYPDKPMLKYAWMAQGGVGTTSIKVRTEDPQFQIGTYYYVTMAATLGQTSLSITLSQSRTISYLTSGITIKDQYLSFQERVKFYYFQVPQNTFKVTLGITALTEDFYPTMILYKNTMTQTPSDYKSLAYPTYNNYTYRFGDNWSYLANIWNEQYSFVDTATTSYTYYTLAIYTFSYGMTDRRKAEYQLSLDISTTNLQLSEEETPVMIELREKEGQSKFLETDSNDKSSFEKFDDLIKGYMNKIQNAFDGFIY